jgi:hypothetical protein
MQWGKLLNLPLTLHWVSCQHTFEQFILNKDLDL